MQLEKLSVEDFKKISSFVYDYWGIKLNEKKHGLAEGRLRKRLRLLKVSSFKEYTKFVMSFQGKDEVVHFIDCLTTNKTSFFREKNHFEYLSTTLLPMLGPEFSKKHRPLRIWSAGCSSGEEVYTIAMILLEWNENNPEIDFKISGTDIALSVLRKATKGVYTEEEISPIPLDLRKKYLLRTMKSGHYVKMAPELRDHVSFSMYNLKEDELHPTNKFDIIFCRNVLIYFDRETNEKIISGFCSSLQPGGHLFLGHSETIHGFDVPLDLLSPTTYRLKV